MKRVLIAAGIVAALAMSASAYAARGSHFQGVVKGGGTMLFTTGNPDHHHVVRDFQLERRTGDLSEPDPHHLDLHLQPLDQDQARSVPRPRRGRAGRGDAREWQLLPPGAPC